MTNLLEIKPLIRNFVEENLDESFENKVYWIGERYRVPETPYCVLTELSENKDKRTSTHNGRYNDETDKRNIITTLYKVAVITVSIYNDAIGDNYDVHKEFAYSEINKLEELFETKRVHEEFYPDFTIQNISPIRALHETTDGGYQYRYEFDLTIGFNEIYKESLDIGKEIEVKLHHDSEDGALEIWFEVDSETGQINDLL